MREGIRTYEIETFTGPIIHDAHPDPDGLRAGDVCTIHGRVAGAEDPASLSVTAVPSKDVKTSLSPVPVDSAGNFRVSLSPLRSGIVPTMLELRDRQGDVVDSRTLALRVAPRVVVSDVRVEDETLTGRLRNAGTTGASVKVSCGKKSVSVGQLAPGQAAEFRLAGGIQRRWPACCGAYPGGEQSDRE